MKFSKFFSNLQEAPWYREFLNPVIETINTKGRVLDIGTGSGKLLQILASEKDMECVGVDVKKEMLEEAREKLVKLNVELITITPNEKLPFENNSFEYITICNVLFHLKKDDIDNMLSDSVNLLTNNGKIIILTPTGKENILKLTMKYFSIKNTGIYIWYRATKSRAEKWTNDNYLEEYASNNNLKYKREVVMNGFAQLEILEN